MVNRNTHITGIATGISVVTGLLSVFTFLATPHVKADSTDFQVNVKDALTVSIAAPQSWANGNVGNFLRNKIDLSVSANNSAGFTASMYANSTNLTNTSSNSYTIATLDDSTQRKDFDDNKWGYSLGAYTLNGVTQNSYTLNGNSYGENSTSSGNVDSYYYPVVDTSTSPITVIDGATTPKVSGTQELYFGSKADLDQASGTYTGTVVISVITGTVTDSNDNPNDNPITPTDPATPSTDTNTSDTNATYTGTGTTTGVGSSGSDGTTVYTTTTTSSGTTNTTTQISAGDNTASYASAQGVTTISEGTPLATGLAITSAVAAATGIVFFIIAKRREDEEDEDEY